MLSRRPEPPDRRETVAREAQDMAQRKLVERSARRVLEESQAFQISSFPRNVLPPRRVLEESDGIGGMEVHMVEEGGASASTDDRGSAVRRSRDEEEAQRFEEMRREHSIGGRASAGGGRASAGGEEREESEGELKARSDKERCTSCRRRKNRGNTGRLIFLTELGAQTASRAESQTTRTRRAVRSEIPKDLRKYTSTTASSGTTRAVRWQQP